MKYKFKEKMYTNPVYSKYYSKYKGHEFILLNVPYGGHWEIQCVSDPRIKVCGLVHRNDMEPINEKL